MNTLETTKFEELLGVIPQARANLPTNTIAHIFRHEQKENFISDWLAFLLNPEYTGSEEMLAALLQLASATRPEKFYDVSIFREVAFDDKRRIDFIIETDSHIVGIENKIWSNLQPDQLKDYEIQLKKISKEVNKTLVLILLYPRRNMFCSALAEEKLYGFCPVTYEDLIFEFKKIHLNIFENLRAVVLMEDFIVHMEEYIMKESLNSEIHLDMWQFEKANRDRLKELKSALKDSNEQFNNYIKERMQALICNRDPQEEWEIRSTPTYIQLFKKQWDACQVHFELLRAENDGFAPGELKVVLHTQECRKEPRTENLWKMGKGTEESIKISYSSQEDFKRSMSEVFEHLKVLIDKYTDNIDLEMNATNKVPYSSRV